MIFVFIQAVTWIDEGMVKSIRGVTFTTKISPDFEKRMRYAARGIFNRLIPDVHIFTDHKSGPAAGRYIFGSIFNMFFSCLIAFFFFTKVICMIILMNVCNFNRSPGYGISLVAETTTGCLISADKAVSDASENVSENFDEDEKPELTPPEELGVQVASLLLEEIEQGGVVDSTHQVYILYFYVHDLKYLKFIHVIYFRVFCFYFVLSAPKMSPKFVLESSHLMP